MQDDLDIERYGDDFSESGNFTTASNDHEDDEQHAQKVNAQVENLEMLLEDLRSELNSEKLEHSKTIILLREANLTNEEPSPSPPTEQESGKSVPLAFYSGISAQFGRSSRNRLWSLIFLITIISDYEFEDSDEKSNSQSHNFSMQNNGEKVRNQDDQNNDSDAPASLRTEIDNLISILSTKSIPIGKIQNFNECDEIYCISALHLIK